jgi:ubiquinone/menaquinone biosynthesis C-methylase UbiE
MSGERDYVLGTHDAEVERLGLQHRVWRPTVLDCWQRAGIGPGARVLDVGAGPGWATLDLAEIVGPEGEVVAVERSARFLEAARSACENRGIRQVQFHELDLMSDSIPAESMEFAWCRWVASFVPSPRTLVERIAPCLKPGGIAIFHEYSDYGTFRIMPPRQWHREFVQKVVARWHLIGHLRDSGFSIREAVPRVFPIRPGDPMWQWPSSFIEIHLDRLRELGSADRDWAERTRQEFRATESDPQSIMITPMVLEIIAVLS